VNSWVEGHVSCVEQHCGLKNLDVVLNIFILFLSLNYPKWEISSPRFCIFGRKLSDEDIFRQVEIYRGGQLFRSGLSREAEREKFSQAL